MGKLEALCSEVPRNQAPGFSYKVENGSQTKAIIGKAIYALHKCICTVAVLRG